MSQPEGSQAWVVKSQGTVEAAQMEEGHIGSRRQWVGRNTLGTIFQRGVLRGPPESAPQLFRARVSGCLWGSSGIEVAGCLRAVAMFHKSPPGKYSLGLRPAASSVNWKL